MTQSIEGAIANLQAKALALTGMLAAPAAPPEAANQFPFAITYERLGDLALESAGWGNDLALLWTEIHVARILLPAAITLAMTFRDPFLKAIIADPNLGGTVSTVRNIHRTFGTLEWAGVLTIGYRFEIGVKVTLTT